MDGFSFVLLLAASFLSAIMGTMVGMAMIIMILGEAQITILLGLSLIFFYSYHYKIVKFK